MRTWDEILHDPRIDDSGDYDYLVEELPQDEAHWIKGYPCHCDSCGKERRLSYRQVSHFYCWDGYDSMDYTECWECYLQGVIRSHTYKMRRRIKRFKTTVAMYHDTKKMTWQKCWELTENIK